MGKSYRPTRDRGAARHRAITQLEVVARTEGRSGLRGRNFAGPLAAWPADLTPPRGVLVLPGYGLSVRVWRGRLRVADGVGRDRREALVHRAMGRLRRLVVLGHTGLVSLEAVRWLADVGAGYLQLDADGRVLAAFGPQGTDRPGLRRAQARALDTPLGVDSARRLIAEKVAGQAEVSPGPRASRSPRSRWRRSATRRPDSTSR